MKLQITKQEAIGILDGDEIKYKIISDKMVSKSRWTDNHELIIQSINDQKYYRGYYRVGSTEMQDERPWEYDDPEFVEVIPVEKTIIVYVNK